MPVSYLGTAKEAQCIMKHVFVWFDGDVKRHYFSSKSTFNKWLTEFVREGLTVDEFKYSYPKLVGKPVSEIKKHFSSSLFLEKVELDI